MKHFNCIKCKDTGLRIEVNEYVPCECEAGKQLRERANIGNSELPSIPVVHSSLELLEKPLYSPAFPPGVARMDALRLKAIAHTMSINAYGSYGSEADMRTLNEIAMRLETGFYAGRKPSDRPVCFEFAMEFLGNPEASELRAYIESLEARANGGKS